LVFGLLLIAALLVAALLVACIAIPLPVERLTDTLHHTSVKTVFAQISTGKTM